MQRANICKNWGRGFQVNQFFFSGLFFLAVMLWGSVLFGLGAPLKYSAMHWLKSIPAPPPDVAVAEASCPDIRAIPARIDAARAEAVQLAGNEVDGERLAQELMNRGNIALMQEWAQMEQQRLMAGSGPQPLKRFEAMTELEDLRRELRSSLGRVGDGLPACHVDEKRGIADTECIEKNNRSIQERTTKAYNNYLQAVQGPLLKLRKEVKRLIEQELSIAHVESRTDAPGMHTYLMHQRIALLDVVRDYARERGNACVYPDWQKKEAGQ